MDPHRCPDCGRDGPGTPTEGLCPFCLFRAAAGSVYGIVNVLGRSDLGTVYLAKREQSASLVVIKVLNASSNELPTARLRHEQHLWMTISNPQLAVPIAMGVTADGRPYVVRDYVRGRSVSVHCQQSGSDGPAKQDLLARLTDVVARVHDRGLCHGSIKPSNVFVDRRDGHCTLKLMDCGLRLASPEDDLGGLDRLAAELA
jgi:serine/threonine protein kinase